MILRRGKKGKPPEPPGKPVTQEKIISGIRERNAITLEDIADIRKLARADQLEITRSIVEKFQDLTPEVANATLLTISGFSREERLPLIRELHEKWTNDHRAYFNKLLDTR